MLDCDILRFKNIFTRPDDTKLIDLTQSSLNDMGLVTADDYTIVTDKFAMRPDKVALSVYSDDNNFDYILKYNGVSNPLSVYEGQILLIPNKEEMSKKISTPESQNKIGQSQNSPTDTSSTENDFNKAKTEADKKRAEFLKKKFNVNNLAPANVNANGEENIKFVDGKIILGASVTTQDVDCPEQYTRARLKQQILAKNMFGK